MVVGSSYPFLDIFWTMLIFFAWVIWFWMLIVIAWAPTGATRRLVGILLLGGLIALGLEVWRRQMLREFPAGGSGPDESPPDAEIALTRQ